MRINSYQAKRIPLVDILAQLGAVPHHQNGSDIWYLSPFRQEKTPSFHINTEKNTWYDFGSAEGGNALDFAMRFYNCDVAGALHELSHLHLASKVPPAYKPTMRDEADPIIVTSVQPLTHLALTIYLNQRGIDPDLAARYVQEIHYRRNGKNYFALAFASNSGGYELRNPYFKGVYGTKDVTLLHRDKGGSKVTIFEGFMDFLSFLTWSGKAEAGTPVIIMNSAAMCDKTIATLREMGAQTVHLYLDRDASGQKLVSNFQEQLNGLTVIDESGIYAGHKDFNELLQPTLRRGQSR